MPEDVKIQQKIWTSRCTRATVQKSADVNVWYDFDMFDLFVFRMWAYSVGFLYRSFRSMICFRDTRLVRQVVIHWGWNVFSGPLTIQGTELLPRQGFGCRCQRCRWKPPKATESHRKPKLKSPGHQVIVHVLIITMKKQLSKTLLFWCNQICFRSSTPLRLHQQKHQSRIDFKKNVLFRGTSVVEVWWVSWRLNIFEIHDVIQTSRTVDLTPESVVLRHY